MSKPIAPDEATDLVELDAMDVGEWESEQHTPQVADAKLDALVKQTAAPPTGMGPAKNNRHTQALPQATIRPAPPRTPPGENPFDAKTVRSPISVEQAAAEIKAAQAARQAKEAAPPPPPPTSKHTTPASAAAGGIAIGRPTKLGSQPLPRDGGKVATPPAGLPTTGVSRSREAPPPAGTTTAARPATPAAGSPARPGTAPGAPAKRTTPIAGVPVTPAPRPGTDPGPRQKQRLGTEPGAPAKRTTAIAGVPITPTPSRATPPAGSPAVVRRTTPIAGVPVATAPLSPGAVRLATPSAGVKQSPPPPQDFDADSEGWSLPDADESDIYEIATDLPKPLATRPPSAHDDLAVGSDPPNAFALPSDDDEETGFHAEPGDEDTGLEDELVDDFELPQDAVMAPNPIMAASAPVPAAPPPRVGSKATLMGHEAAGTALPSEPTIVATAPAAPAVAPTGMQHGADAPRPAAVAGDAPPTQAPDTDFGPTGTQQAAASYQPPAGATQPMAGAYQAPALTPNVQLAAAAQLTTRAPATAPPAPGIPDAVAQARSERSALPAAAGSGGAQMPFDLLPSHRQDETPVPKRDERHRRTDSFRAVGGRSKAGYVIGGVLGLAAIVAIALFATRSPSDSTPVADQGAARGSADGSGQVALGAGTDTPGTDTPGTDPTGTDTTATDTAGTTGTAGTDPTGATGTDPTGTTSTDPTGTTGARTTGTTGTRTTGTRPTGTTGTRPTGTTKTRPTGTKGKTKGKTKTNPTGATGTTTVATAEPPENTTAREQAKAAYNAGNQRLFAGDPQGAIRAYREALSLMPGYAPGYRGLGLAYEQAGDKANAVKALQQYVKAAPTAKDVEKIKQRIAIMQR